MSQRRLPSAEPKALLPEAPPETPNRHFLQTGQGLVEVQGPPIQEDPVSEIMKRAAEEEYEQAEMPPHVRPSPYMQRSGRHSAVRKMMMLFTNRTFGMLGQGDGYTRHMQTEDGIEEFEMRHNGFPEGGLPIGELGILGADTGGHKTDLQFQAYLAAMRSQDNPVEAALRKTLSDLQEATESVKEALAQVTGDPSEPRGDGSRYAPYTDKEKVLNYADYIHSRCNGISLKSVAVKTCARAKLKDWDVEPYEVKKMVTGFFANIPPEFIDGLVSSDECPGFGYRERFDKVAEYGQYLLDNGLPRYQVSRMMRDFNINFCPEPLDGHAITTCIAETCD